jgi:hypothetical protein
MATAATETRALPDLEKPIRHTLIMHSRTVDLFAVGADWPLIGGSFHVEGVQVLWPRLAAERICAGDLIGADTVQAIHHQLAAEFPIA